MATKFIVVGEPVVPTQKTTFELVLYLNVLNRCYSFSLAENKPENFKYVELIAMHFGPSNLDLMFAYDDPSRRDHAVLYLGRWNGGN